MLIIAGHAEVDPDDRDEAVAVMRDPVTRACEAPGCLDVAITADSVDPTRIDNSERWESQQALDTARSNGPGFEQGGAMLTVSVAEYDIADVRPCSGTIRH